MFASHWSAAPAAGERLLHSATLLCCALLCSVRNAALTAPTSPPPCLPHPLPRPLRPHPPQALALIGEFNAWEPRPDYWAIKNDYGVWQLFLPDNADGTSQIVHRWASRLVGGLGFCRGSGTWSRGACRHK